MLTLKSFKLRCATYASSPLIHILKLGEQRPSVDMARHRTTPFGPSLTGSLTVEPLGGVRDALLWKSMCDAILHQVLKADR